MRGVLPCATGIGRSCVRRDAKHCGWDARAPLFLSAFAAAASAVAKLWRDKMARQVRHGLNGSFIKRTLQLTYTFVNRYLKEFLKKCDFGENGFKALRGKDLSITGYFKNQPAGVESKPATPRVHLKMTLI
jgi:hypothetical protein